MTTQLSGAMPKSAIFVPMIAGGHVTGIISLQNLDHEDAFGEADVRLLQTLAGSMSVALENARLFDEVQKRNQEITEALEQQTATGQILSAIAASPTDIKPVLDAVAQHAARLCEANDVQIYRVDGDVLRQVTHHGPLPALQDGEALPLVPGLVTGRAVLERRTIHVEDMGQLSESEYPDSVQLQKRLRHRTAISTPLLREGKAIGAIVVRRNEARPFTEKQIALLSTFADQAAIAIENVRLFTETQRLLKETQQRAAELAVINSVQKGLASKLDMQAIYDLVGDKIRDIFETEVVYIAVRESEKSKRVDFPYYLDRGNRLSVEPVTVGEGITSRVIESRRPLVAGSMERQLELGGIYDDEEKSLSYLGVPIFLGDAVLGVASVQSYQADAFDEADVRLLSTLASSMGVALENARLFNETQRLLKETEQRAAELAIINSVQDGLASKLDMQAIYDLVGDKIRDIFGNVDLGIRIYDETTNLLHFPYTYEGGKRITIPAEPLGERGFTAHVLHSREPLLINEGMMERMEEFGSSLLPGTLAEKSGLYVPLIIGQEAKGLINLINMEREHAFGESDVRLLTTVANSMSVALENARLFDETQRLLKETEQRAAELAIINSVQQALASKLEYQAIVDVVGEKIRSIFDAQSIAIGSYDHAASTVHYSYVVQKGGRVEDKPAPFGGLTRHLIETRRTLVINDNLAQRLEDIGSTPFPAEMDVPKSAVYVPLLVGECVTGVINLANLDRENAFADSDIRLLQTLAGSMGVALENARLFDETQRLLKETEQRAAELEIINSVQEGFGVQAGHAGHLRPGRRQDQEPVRLPGRDHCISRSPDESDPLPVLLASRSTLGAVADRLWRRPDVTRSAHQATTAHQPGCREALRGARRRVCDRGR